MGSAALVGLWRVGACHGKGSRAFGLISEPITSRSEPYGRAESCGLQVFGHGHIERGFRRPSWDLDGVVCGEYT